MKNNPLPRLFFTAFFIALLTLLPAACSKQPASSAPKDEPKTSGNANARNAAGSEKHYAPVPPNGRKAQPSANTPEAAPESPDSELLNAGLALHKQGNDDAAVVAFEEAVDINPNNAPSLNNLGNYAFLDGNYVEAKKYYQWAVEADPKFAEGWYDLGNAALAIGMAQGGEEGRKLLAEAEQHYRHALKINPDFTLAQDNLGRLLRWMGRPEEAAVYLKKVNEKKSNEENPSQ